MDIRVERERERVGDGYGDNRVDKGASREWIQRNR